ncbi:hypothetical protein GCM10020221_06940 [Streptomyces thioluteus]|uniref:Uncharacterized protein n=1 Tax=Streptomyces thioluteus TaxID=66431 RepID=A0ABN3WGD9_STRTU
MVLLLRGGHALDPVLPYGLAGRHVDGDHGHARPHQVLGVGVHEEQVVVGVGHDLEQQRALGVVERPGGPRVHGADGGGAGGAPAGSAVTASRGRDGGHGRDSGEHSPARDRTSVLVRNGSAL